MKARVCWAIILNSSAFGYGFRAVNVFSNKIEFSHLSNNKQEALGMAARMAIDWYVRCEYFNSLSCNKISLGNLSGNRPHQYKSSFNDCALKLNAILSFC